MAILVMIDGKRLRVAGARGLGAALAAGLLALGGPALARATSYCVQDSACVAAGGTAESAPTPGDALQNALSDAERHTGPNAVEIGPGTYSLASKLEAFAYEGEAVTIEGSGEGVTTLTAPAESNDLAVLTLKAPGAVVSGLTLEVPGESDNVKGLSISEASAEHVAITGEPEAHASAGVRLEGSHASFADGTIEAVGTGVEGNGSKATVADSTVRAPTGAVVSLGELDVLRCRIAAIGEGIRDFSSRLIVEDTLVDMQPGEGEGEALSVGGNSAFGDAEAKFLQDTIVSSGGSKPGLKDEAGDAPSEALVRLEDTILAGFAHPIEAESEEEGAVASVTSDYSSYEASGDVLKHPAGVPAPTILDEHAVSANPGFVKPVFGAHGFSEGDWQLRYDSPLIDAGSPAPLAAEESSTDLAGDPRVVGGRRDVGAYEYQRRAPVVSVGAVPASVAVGTPIAFSGSASEPEPEDPVGYQWTFDDGASVPAGAAASHAFLTPGVHSATLTATDGAGVKSSVTVTVRVIGVLFGSAPPHPRRPMLSQLKLTPTAFRAARRGASIARSHATGTSVSFRLSMAARVSFYVERALPGVRRGSSCLQPRRGGVRRGRRCTRYVRLVGHFAYAGRSGADSMRFTGRFGGRSLSPGEYRLVAVPSIIRGRRGASVTATFRILG
ncbi:MAG TPA: PKD domain-containing protein [Solirubrobacteraceae bacterium]|jgi:hypothetical protein|nr:PKD domain-containing protein [Solirubrobacteraceae bacterium]